ncbi:MAG: hypothetical protein R3D98_15405 [Candidatus Krumholzibacteriia bacterium]
MGLALSVGLLGDLKANDAEGFATFSAYFNEVNVLLAENGLPAHVEPDTATPWDAEMFGYSGLHYLRRIAAYVDSGLELPPPGDQNSSDDTRLQAYFNDVTGVGVGALKKLFQKRVRFKREFDHLIVHSDAEGFYLPIDFPNVLLADDGRIPGGMVGSTPRLLAESDRLARILGIPSHLTNDSEELCDAADSQGEGGAIWQKYGVESFSCVSLREACRRSMDTGAAVVFA